VKSLKKSLDTEFKSSKKLNKFEMIYWDETGEMIVKTPTFEDKLLSSPMNFYGMYLTITDEEWEQVLKENTIWA